MSDNNMSTNVVEVSDDTIAIRVTPVPGQPKIVTLPTGATVADALKAAGISTDSTSVLQVNASPAKGNTVLADSDRITVAKGAKGNI
jgi:sulfur carrier protein ThiS